MFDLPISVGQILFRVFDDQVVELLQLLLGPTKRLGLVHLVWSLTRLVTKINKVKMKNEVSSRRCNWADTSLIPSRGTGVREKS